MSTSDLSPSRAALRRLLLALFKGDSDLDKFLIDRFFEVKQQLAAGMDRVSRTNVLLEQVTPEDLWAVLKRFYGAGASQYQHLLAEEAKASKTARWREELRGELDRLEGDLKAYRRYGDSTAKIDEKILDVRRKLRTGPTLQERDLLSGRYSLMQELGKGGVATVWQAYDQERSIPDAQRVVAIKVLHGQYSADISVVERFRRGARKMKELKHAAIVRVLDGPSEDDEQHYFVMEYVPNRTLYEAVLSKQINRQQGIDAILRIGEALAEAHRSSLIHRDVKPHNILLDSQWKARLTDFDLVLGPDNTALSIVGSGKGTFGYAPPELVRGLPGHDLRIDVYGLAMTTVFVLRGEELPFPELSPREAIAALPESEAIKQVLHRGTAIAKNDRHDSIPAYCDALNRALTEKPPLTPLPSPPPLALATRQPVEMPTVPFPRIQVEPPSAAPLKARLKSGQPSLPSNSGPRKQNAGSVLAVPAVSHLRLPWLIGSLAVLLVIGVAGLKLKATFDRLPASSTDLGVRAGGPSPGASQVATIPALDLSIVVEPLFTAGAAPAPVDDADASKKGAINASPSPVKKKSYKAAKDDLDSLLDAAANPAPRAKLPKQLTNETINSTLNAIDITACQQRGGYGVVLIRMKISGNGRVSDAEVTSWTVKDVRGADCVLAKVKKAQFPAFSGAPIELWDHAFTFK